MPPVIIGAAVSAGLGAAIGGAAFGTLFVQNLALGLVAKALAPKPPTPERRDNTVTAREPASSRKIVYGRTRVGGTIVYLESTGDDNKYLHLVIAIAGHEINSFEKVYFDDTLVWDGGTYQDGWGSHARLNFKLGTDAQTADSDLVSESSHWTADHKLSGVAYIYARLKYDQDRYSSGIPNVTAVVEGKKVFDPRSGQTVFSSNPALCIRDYLLDSKYGVGVEITELNNASIVAAANLCDETVTTTSGSQLRYKLDGVVDSASNPKDTLEGMLTSCAGSLVYSGGEFYLYGSEYKTPTITLDESVVTSAISVQTRKSRRELFNAVKGIFSSEADNFVLTDYPAIVSATYSAEDGGEIYLDVDLPYTTNPIRAERIAKLSLLRTRQQITATIPCNLSALRLKAGDTVMINNTRFGWTNKVFEIINLRLSAGDQGQLGVELQVIETAPAVYDWTTSDEIAFVAGQPTTLAGPFSVIAPTGLSLTATANIQEDGTARPAIEISFTNNDAFTATYEIQYQQDSGSYRSILTRETNYRLEDVVVGSTYNVRVRAINNLGARSTFATASTTGVGDNGAPSAPTNLSATGQFNAINLVWTNPSDSDLDVIEVYEGTSSIQANATLIATTKSSSYVRGALENGVTRYYWLKALDYSGNRSGFNSATGVSATTLIPVSEEDIVGTIEVVDTLTAGLGASDIGKVEFLTTDEKLYRWDGTQWITGVSIDDVTGSITANRLDVATLSSITANIGTLNAGKLQNNDATFIVDLDNKKIFIS
jgi:hypothetical protein